MSEINIKINKDSFKEKLGIKDVDMTPVISSINELSKYIKALDLSKSDNKEVMDALSAIANKDTDDSNMILAVNLLSDKIETIKAGPDYTEKFNQLMDTLATQGRLRAGYNPYNPQIRNIAGQEINPATEEKQDAIVSAISALGGAVNYATQVDKTSTTDVIYIGEATIGSATSSAVWRIQKVDNTGGNTVIKWADGNDNFDNIYDNRTSLTYS